MSKKSVVTSIAASMVLATVLGLSGCGGSHNGTSGSTDSTTKATGLTPGSQTEPTAGDLVINDSNPKFELNLGGNTEDGTGKAATLRCVSVKDKDDKDTCTKKKDKCSIKVKLESTSCVKREEANPRYTSNYGITALNYLDGNRGKYNYDPKTDMIVYGGAVVMDIKGFSSGDIKIDVKGMKCGMGIKHSDGSAIPGIGFANEGHKVFALIKVHDKDGNQVVADQWAPVDTMDESGNFTIDLNGIDLGDGKDGYTVEALLLSVKPAVGDKVGGTTGVSGAGS